MAEKQIVSLSNKKIGREARAVAAAGGGNGKQINGRVPVIDIGRDLRVGKAVGTPSVPKAKIKAAVKAVIKERQIA